MSFLDVSEIKSLNNNNQTQTNFEEEKVNLPGGIIQSITNPNTRKITNIF